MKTPVEKAERVYIRLVAAIGGGILLLVLLVWGGLHVFHQWQERHLVRRAAAYLSGGDAQKASLDARRAYQLNPESPDAARLLAEIAQRTGDRAELGWRRKVLEFRPDSTDDALALVRTALGTNDLATAEQTLQHVTEAGRNTAAYHAALARLAEIRNNRPEAEAQWREAAELAPEEGAYRTQLALVQLASEDEAKRASARQALKQLRSDEEQRTAATRALIADAASRRVDPQAVRGLAEELQAYPDALFGDRLLYLEILRQLKDARLADYLKTLQQEAAENAGDLASLLTWMHTNGMANEAIPYSNALAAEMLTKWPVPLALAETYAKAENWARLQQFAKGASWGAFDFVRHAYLARAARATEDKLAAEQAWSQAQKAASAQPQALLVLARTVAGWNWQKETLDLLWELAKAPETSRQALQELYQYYAKNGDTSGIYRVLLRSAQIAPDDLNVQNNFAQVSLLLDADPDRARKIAAQLAQKEPANAAYRSTYAFSLLTGGDVQKALAAFEGLSDEQLRAPSTAVYYGVILAAAGEKEKSREFLAVGAKAFLLPEERALLEKAQTSVQ